MMSLALLLFGAITVYAARIPVTDKIHAPSGHDSKTNAPGAGLSYKQALHFAHPSSPVSRVQEDKMHDPVAIISERQIAGKDYPYVPAGAWLDCARLSARLNRACYVRGGACRCPHEIAARPHGCNWEGYCRVEGGFCRMIDALPNPTNPPYPLVPATTFHQCGALIAKLQRDCYVGGGYCRCETMPAPPGCEHHGYCRIMGGWCRMFKSP